MPSRTFFVTYSKLQVLQFVTNAVRHGEAAWFLISCKICKTIMQPRNENWAV